MAYTLCINGVEQDLAENKISLRSVEVSWAGPHTFGFVESTLHCQASYSVEDTVTFAAAGAVRFRGRIKRVELEGVPNAERVVYVCMGLRELTKDVWLHDPAHGYPRLVFNAPADDEDYDPAKSGKTVGEIVAWLFDHHADELRAAGVIDDAPATGYVSDELDELDVVPPKLVFESEHFDAALCELMDLQHGHRLIAEPDTRTFHFRRVAELPAKTLTYNSPDKPLSAVLRPSTQNRATAVEICGPMRPINETATLSGGGLDKFWNPGHEAGWTWAKCFDPDNADTYGRVFRRFQIADSGKRHIARSLVEPDALGAYSAARCPQVYRKTTGGEWARVPAMFDFRDGVILLAQPATVGDEYKEGAADCADDICLIYSYLDDPLSARSPAAGYQGTAYTEPQNPVEVVRRFYDEHFVLPDQTSAYENAAAQLLTAYEDIVYAGTVRLAKLDWSLTGLGHRLNFTGQDDDGEPVETGFESLGAMMLSVSCDLARQHTEIVLSTDPSEFGEITPALASRLRELETQARRAQRYRALQGSTHGSTPRAGNDGEAGADVNSRGVYSLRRHQDSEDARIAGHVELEAGDGISIARQADDEHTGFKISAQTRGQWHWFHYQLNNVDASKTYDMHARGGYVSLDWYPVSAGKLTRVTAYTPGSLTAGTVTVKPSKKTKTGGAACPEDRTDPGSPSAVLTASTNIDHDTTSPGIDLADQDVLGLRVITDADYAIAGYSLDVIAGAYFEEG